MSTCGHELRAGIRCTVEAGLKHTTHSFYEDQPSDNPNESNFVVLHEWNDKREQWLEREHGEAIDVDYDEGPVARAKAMRFAVLAAEKSPHIPNGAVYEIRAKEIPKEGRAFDYGRVKRSRRQQAVDWGIAWYYVPPAPDGFNDEYRRGFANDPLFVNTPETPVLPALGGYLLLARIRKGTLTTALCVN
jgi:hypothetical protein